MKTIDEVLEAMTYEVDLNSKADCWEVPVDLYGVIIHYLHEYRDAKNTLDVERKNSIEAYCQWKDAKEKLEAQISWTMWADNHFQFEISDNPPLTWEELKTMERKPVWVEVKYHNPEADYKYWTIVKYFESNEGGDMVFTGTGFYYKDLLGIDWMAYRKER